MTVTWDGQTLEERLFLACAGNAEDTGGGTMRLSPGARVDDGVMNISIVENFGRLEAIRSFPKLLAGAHTAHPKVRYVTTTQLSITADPPLSVQLDGDIFGSTPVTFTLRPGALRVMTGTRNPLIGTSRAAATASP